VAKRDIRVYTHCNGDAAIDILLDACEAAGIKAGDDRRDVVIHSQFMRPEQLDAYAKYGLTPSFFTAHAFFWGDVHVENLGRERAFFLSPMKSALAKGLHPSNHTDYSVTPMEPMRMVWSAVTRQSRSGTIMGPDECVSVWEALQAITINAAWQYKEEDEKGTLEAGKLADLVILDANPLTVAADDILNIKVVETLKEGVTVYKAQ
jgi:predicted amidohydrolase YtcJ